MAKFVRHRGTARSRLDLQRQYDRKPARCQRITVSGRMMAGAPQVFEDNPQTQPRTNLSLADDGNQAYPTPAQHNDLLPKHQDLRFQRRP